MGHRPSQGTRFSSEINPLKELASHNFGVPITVIDQNL
jgi:hypothetical protein